jgi:23S rRNA (cytosine1962-C5)-methyltransferase
MRPDHLFSRLVPTIFEDASALVLHKPPGIDVGGAVEGDSGLLDVLARLRGDSGELFVTNRLSRYESGVLVLAKTETLARHIRTGLREKRIQQQYLAVSLLAGAGSAKKTAPRKSDRNRGKRPGKSGAGPAGGTVPSSETTFRVLGAAGRRALVQCDTIAATTHELRAQLRGAGMRLWGDRIGAGPRRPVPHHVTHLHLARFAYHDPGTGSKRVFHATAPEGFDRPLSGSLHPPRALAAALSRRLRGLIDVGSDSYRLITGDKEGLSELVAQRWGDLVVIELGSGGVKLNKRDLRGMADWFVETLEVGNVACRAARSKVRAGGGKGMEEPAGLELIRGGSVPETVVIEERGLRFEVKPGGGASAGLFLDQRENRSRVRALAEGGEVLNLFAYTCGFSVAAAAGGAKRTVSVDIATGSLDWGRRNFELNGIDLGDHVFIRSDAGEYLKRATRQGLMFDLIVIDAPTFAHARRGGKPFAVKAGLEGLVHEAAARLRPGGTMMVTVNQRTLAGRWLRERVLAGCSGRARVIETPKLPFDFEMDADHSKTIVVGGE